MHRENPARNTGAFHAPCRTIRLAALIFPIVLGGCQDADDNALTIATVLTGPERENLEKMLIGQRPVRWIMVSSGDDLERLVRRRNPPDLIMGSPASLFESLAAQGLLEPDEPGGPSWREIARWKLGMAAYRPARGAPAPRLKSDLTFDDPRVDRISMAWMESELRRDSWAGGYVRLVRQARGARPPGRQTGAALAAVERGEVGMAPAVCAQSHKVSWDFEQIAPWGYGVAVVRGGPHAAEARAFLKTFFGSFETPPPTLSPAARSLTADLLGATLVEAHEELVAAWSALDAAKDPERPIQWMTQAPPWPPASVAKLLAAPNAMPMVETLAAEIAPEPDVRAWLLRSWLAPPRLIDGALIDELAGAVEGRLVREPRFREWLRGEWTAWARQRYRRVARRASGGTPTPAGVSS